MKKIISLQRGFSLIAGCTVNILESTLRKALPWSMKCVLYPDRTFYTIESLLRESLVKLSHKPLLKNAIMWKTVKWRKDLSCKLAFRRPVKALFIEDVIVFGLTVLAILVDYVLT